jgi:hypothetical protein
MSMDTNLQLAFQSVATAIKARQTELVSGTNIKTINGISILGEGDLVTPSYSNTLSSSLLNFTNAASIGFTVNTVGAYIIGNRVRIIDQNDTSRWMEGIISTTLNDNYILVAVDDSSNVTGSSNAWKFAIAGEKGVSDPNIVIQVTEPIIPTGQQILWIETKESGDISLWIKTGE